MQMILSYLRRCVEDYDMIHAGERIAVGVSGGKDSLVLLYAMAKLREFYPEPFELHAVTVHPGAPGMDFGPVAALCRELNVPYHLSETEIFHIIFDLRQEKNPCSMCAKMRRGAMHSALQELGIHKVALGHHRDDAVETLLLSLIFEGRFHTFSPVTYWDRIGLTLIRPLILMDEADIIGFQNKYQLPVAKSPCPADGRTKREYIKNLLKSLNKDHPGTRERMFAAILSGGLKGWEDFNPYPRRPSGPG